MGLHGQSWLHMDPPSMPISLVWLKIIWKSAQKPLYQTCLQWSLDGPTICQRLSMLLNIDISWNSKTFIFYQMIGVLNFIFVSDLELPDTFNSWFLVTELHMWFVLSSILITRKFQSMIENSEVTGPNFKKNSNFNHNCNWKIN